MNTFHTIFWWFGVTLFSVATLLFYGLLIYSIGRGVWDYFKK